MDSAMPPMLPLVDMAGVLKSPWCRHLLGRGAVNRFSIGFTLQRRSARSRATNGGRVPKTVRMHQEPEATPANHWSIC
jgi:hypothetical protein